MVVSQASRQVQAVYDEIGTTYQSTRRADARIASLINGVLPPDGSLLNVGAGTGSYEPAGLQVVAVEPSNTMIAQRGALSAPVVRAVAEALPFASNSFDVVLGVLTLHHWHDLTRGLNECRRVARQRMVFLTWDPHATNFWLVDEYFPQILDQARSVFPTMSTLQELMREARVLTVPIPADCSDGFLGAYWTRPEAYLDATVRQGISAFSLVGNIGPSLDRLASDLKSGAWRARHHALQSVDALDLGYRLVVAEVS